jgi:hypothetical protein
MTMRFGFSEEQRLFASTLRDVLEKECTPRHLRDHAGPPAGHWPELWTRLAEVGLLGGRAPAEHGGLGLDEIDLVLALEETGRAAVPGPVVETVAVAVPALAADPRSAERWLPGIAAGEVLVTAAFDDAPYAPGATVADLIVAQVGGSLQAVPGSVVEPVPQAPLDPGRAPARTEFRMAPGTRIEGADVGLSFDRGVMGISAQLIGLSARMLEMAAEYARDRHQFGRPIGSFQAVKHLLADALVRLEFARPAVYRAAHSVARGVEDRSLHVSMAKALASDAAAQASRAALQVHGAISYTEEHDLHLWLRRARSLTWAWGTAARHRDRIRAALLD